jgi:hypothetical protein
MTSNATSKILCTTIFILLLATVPCRADVIFTTGNHPQADEQNVLMKSGATGTTVTGTTNVTATIVDFSSSQTLVEPSHGQARLEAAGRSVALTNVAISIPGGTYKDLILNPFNKGTPAGTANLSVVANDGTFTYSYPLTHGNNFLTITTTNGETIDSTTLTVANGIDDLRQVRISGVGGSDNPNDNVVPEPRSVLLWAVLGLGLVFGVAWQSLRGRGKLIHA